MNLAPIARALPYAGTHTLEDIELGIAEGKYQLWGNLECGIVTELLETPLRKTCHFFLAAGHLEGLKAMTPAVLEWARSVGCSHASLIGRRGWSRSFLVDCGWRQTGVLMEVDLNGLQGQRTGRERTRSVGDWPIQIKCER